MDDSSYRLNFDLDKNKIYHHRINQITNFGRKSCNYEERIAVRSLQILCVFVLRAEVLTTFGSKVVVFSARNTKIYKICKLRTAIFSAFYNISRPNFVILLNLRCSF